MTVERDGRGDAVAMAATRESIDNNMGTRPTQALFIGYLAVALTIMMIAATAFVLLPAMTYG